MIRIIVDIEEKGENKLDITVKGRPCPEGSKAGYLESQYAEKLTYKINRAVDETTEETGGESETIIPFRLLMRRDP